MSTKSDFQTVSKAVNELPTQEDSEVEPVVVQHGWTLQEYDAALYISVTAPCFSK